MDELPLFPLPLVLNPGGELSLKIFEPRYLDMVRDCARRQSPFGICALITHQSSDHRGISAIGCAAKIVDFDTLPNGLLGIEVVGLERFRLLGLRTQADGLCIGSVEAIPPEPALPVPPEYGLLSEIVAGILGGSRKYSLGRDQLDHSSWVGFRLSECLPLELDERQQLLETSDPLARLALLASWLPRFQRSDDEHEH